jgi:hypothetical protein
VDKKEKKSKKHAGAEQGDHAASASTFALLADEKSVDSALSSLFAVKVREMHRFKRSSAENRRSNLRSNPKSLLLSRSRPPIGKARARTKMMEATKTTMQSFPNWKTMTDLNQTRMILCVMAKTTLFQNKVSRKLYPGKRRLHPPSASERGRMLKWSLRTSI